MNADTQKDALGPDDPFVELAAEVFALLADATRVRLVLALSSGEKSVGELAEIVGKAPTAVSQHLAKLRMARAVTTRQEGTRVNYQLANNHALRLVKDAIDQAEHTVDGTPRHHHAGAS